MTVVRRRYKIPQRYSDQSTLRAIGLHALSSMFFNFVRGIAAILLRYSVFGGILGLLWVFALGRPGGPLIIYLLPIILLAIPLCLVSKTDKGWEAFLSTILALTIFFDTVFYLYFLYWELPHTGQFPIYLVAGLLVVFTGGVVIFRDKGKSLDRPREGVLRLFWAVGVILLPIASALIFLLARGSWGPLGPDSSILLSAFAFLLCFALILIRVFWLDAMKFFRAWRVTDLPLDDIFVLLELLMPRSMFLWVMVPTLLVSEGVLFSVVYKVTAETALAEEQKATSPRISKLSDGKKTQSTGPKPGDRSAKVDKSGSIDKSPKSDKSGKSERTVKPGKTAESDQSAKSEGSKEREGRSKGSEGKTPTVGESTTLRSKSPAGTGGAREKSGRGSPLPRRTGSEPAKGEVEAVIFNGDYRLLDWVFFAVRPYVFPRDKEGRELDAPAWIKPFGRVLLSIIILFLFTYQLTVWSQFKNAYYRLWVLVRKGADLPSASEKLRSEWREAQMDLRARLNYLGGGWRKIILYAATAPFHWLSWKWILDPGRAFKETVITVTRTWLKNWDQAFFASTALFSLIAGTVSVITGYFRPFWMIFIPLLTISVALLAMKHWVHPDPPVIKRGLAYFLFVGQFALSLIFFFLSIATHNIENITLKIIWYTFLFSIAPFPILYFFAADRMLDRDLYDLQLPQLCWDSAKRVRSAFLEQFFYIEHRLWVTKALIYRVFPVRSEFFCIQFVIPSLMIGLFKSIRSVIQKFVNFINLFLSSPRYAIKVRLKLIVIFDILALIIISLSSSQDLASFLYSFSLISAYSIFPFALIQILLFFKNFFQKNESTNEKFSYKRLFTFSAVVSILAAFLLMFHLRGTFSDVLVYSLTLLLFACYYPFEYHFIYRDRESENRIEFLKNQKKVLSLQGPISFFLKYEQKMFSGSYKKIHQRGRTDSFLRDKMCDGLVEVVLNSKKSLSEGHWFREEQRELEIVNMRWLSGGYRDSLRELSRPAEELAQILSLSLDVLGALIHDRFDSKRRELIEQGLQEERPKNLYTLPSLERVTFAIQRLLSLSPPILDPRIEKLENRFYLQELRSVYDDLQLLLATFSLPNTSRDFELNLSERERKLLSIPLKQLELLLDRESPAEGEADSSSPAVEPEKNDGDEELFQFQTDESAREDIPKYIGSFDNIDNFTGEKSEYCSDSLPPEFSQHLSDDSSITRWWQLSEELPTPLAIPVEKYSLLLREEREFFRDPFNRYVSPLQLNRENEFPLLREKRAELSFFKNRNAFLKRRWKLLRQIYWELQAFTLAGIKSSIPHHRSYRRWLELQWDSPEQLKETYNFLANRKERGLAPELEQWKEFFLQKYEKSGAFLMNTSSVSEKLILRVEEYLFSLLSEASRELFVYYPLTWRWDVLLPTNLRRFSSIPIFVEFFGVHPKILFWELPDRNLSKSADIREKLSSLSLNSPLLTSGSLYWKGLGPLEFNRIYVWTAKWMLKKLLLCAYSFDLWLEQDERTEPQSPKKLYTARKNRLLELKQLADDIGSLLSLVARDEQELIDLLFKKLNHRLELLNYYIEKGKNSRTQRETPELTFKNDASFWSTLRQVKQSYEEHVKMERLRRSQLIYAGTLPSIKFTYLSKVEFCDDEELLYFSNGLGQLCDILPKRVWQKNIHTR